jgi:serine/threonine protein phosphatase PrpC
MEVQLASLTDIGTKKDTNQDSYCLKLAQTDMGKVVFAVVCDGVGGLSKGELASAGVVKAFSNWFEREFPKLYDKTNFHVVKTRWKAILDACNKQISSYGSKTGTKLGTTFTALLITESGNFLVGHIGDSRVYVYDKALKVLTDDHTVTGAAMRAGRMTPEEAAKDPRRNVLVQCVGASPELKPDFVSGKVSGKDAYLLCSDGFRNRLTHEELADAMRSVVSGRVSSLKGLLSDLIETCKRRGEKDNITAVVIRLS